MNLAILPSRLREHLEDLAFFTDRSDRIDALIAWSGRYKRVPAEIAAPPYEESHRVPGCESEAFVWKSESPDGPEFWFAVENPQGVSAMALAALLQDGLKGASAEQIRALPDEVVYEVFGSDLSMGKSMGLMGMIRMVKALA